MYMIDKCTRATQRLRDGWLRNTWWLDGRAATACRRCVVYRAFQL